MRRRAGFLATAALLAAACGRPDGGRQARGEASAPGASGTAPASERAGERAGLRRGDRHARAAARRPPEVRRIEGMLARATGRTVAIRPRGEPVVTLRIAPSTTVTIDGRPARIESLREGASVRAAYQAGDGGRPTALSIEAREVREPPRSDRGGGGERAGSRPD